MASDEIKVSVRNLNFATLKVTTHFTREFRLRFWLFRQLIYLACLIVQCDVEIAPEKS